MEKKEVAVSEAVKAAGYEPGPAYERALKAVRMALQRGQVPGKKDLAGQWLVDPAVVATYLASRQDKGAGRRFDYQQKIRVSGRTLGVAFATPEQYQLLLNLVRALDYPSLSAMVTDLDEGKAAVIAGGVQAVAGEGEPVGRLRKLARLVGFAGVSPLLRALADDRAAVVRLNGRRKKQRRAKKEK